MHLRIFPIDPKLRTIRLMKIGFFGHRLYVSPIRIDRIDIWSIHSFIPNSWQNLLSLPVIQLLYSFYAIGDTQPYVYALIVALFDCDVPRISIFRVDMDSGDYTVYDLDQESGQEFEDKVFLDNVVLICARNQLFLYERSVVMGPIPFWSIALNEEQGTFVLTNKTIPGEPDESKCSRYPVVVDGQQRMVFKLNDNHQIRVFDGNADQWDTFLPAPRTCIDLSEIRVKGVCETYGRTVHRMGAIESPLTFFTNGRTCIAKIYSNSYHHFHQISFDSDVKQYHIEHLCKCRLPSYINQRFYAACKNTLFAFICSAGIAFISLGPPKLRELAFLAIQKQFCSIDDGRWSGGISEQQIKQICSFRSNASLI